MEEHMQKKIYMLDKVGFNKTNKKCNNYNNNGM